MFRRLFRLPVILFLIYFSLANILFVAANIPFWQRATEYVCDTCLTPFIHRGFLDYLTYISFIREGSLGHFQVPALYTTEPTQSASMYVYYIINGYLGKLVNLDPIQAYHLGRFLSVEIFIIALYLLSVVLTNIKLGFLMSIFSLLATTPLKFFSFRLIGTDGNLFIPVGFGHMNPLTRLDFPPHHQVGTALLFISIAFFVIYLRQNRKFNLLMSMFSAFLCGLFYPAPAFVFIFGLPLTILLVVIKKILVRKKINPSELIPLILVMVAGAIGIGFIQMEMSKGFPWSQWSAWETGLWNNYSEYKINFILAQLPYLTLALPLIIIYLWKNNSIVNIFMSSWAVLPYILLPLAKLLNVAQIRFVWISNYIPLTFFGILFFKKIYQYLPTKIKFLFLIIILVAWFGFTIPSLQEFYKMNVSFHQTIRVPSMAFPKTTIEAINFIDKNSPAYPTVLSHEMYGILMPAYGRIRTYFSHEVHTKNYVDKMKIVMAFYSGEMSPKAASDLIKNNSIDFIYFGPFEKNLGNEFLKYNLPIKLWYKNADTEIYQVH